MLRPLILGAITCFMLAQSAVAGIFEDFPDVILCKIDGGTLVVYLDRALDDGGAIYKGLGGSFATVDADGVFHRENQQDCDGKTLDELRAAGKTRDFAN